MCLISTHFTRFRLKVKVIEKMHTKLTVIVTLWQARWKDQQRYALGGHMMYNNADFKGVLFCNHWIEVQNQGTSIMNWYDYEMREKDENNPLCINPTDILHVLAILAVNLDSLSVKLKWIVPFWNPLWLRDFQDCIL